MSHDRWYCQECGEIVCEDDALKAPSPFEEGFQIYGCPHCKEVEPFVAACAIEACKQQASCGGPGNDGVYRQTCYEHADWVHKDKK